MPELGCPGCGAPMVEVESSGVAIDVCSSCMGLWLDRGELERLGAPLPSHRAALDAAARRNCPRCLAPLEVHDAQVAKVDLCRECGGLFLDPGALEALGEASGAGAAPRVAPGLAAPGSARAPAPVSPSAVSGQAAAAALPEEAPRQVFWCDLCHSPAPIEEQVVGERLTVCGACAARRQIRHDPAARRRAEGERDLNNRYVRNYEGPFSLDTLLDALILLFRR